MGKYIEIDGIGEVVPRSEYDALSGQIEALITTEPEWAKLGAILGEKQANAFKLQREHHLRQVRADAVTDFIEFMYKSKDCQLCSKSLDKANQYHASILQEEK